MDSGSVASDQADAVVELEPRHGEYHPFGAYETALEWGLVPGVKETAPGALTAAPLPLPPLRRFVPQPTAPVEDAARAVALGLRNPHTTASQGQVAVVVRSGTASLDCQYHAADAAFRKRAAAAGTKRRADPYAPKRDASGTEARALSHTDFLRAYAGGEGGLNPLTLIQMGRYKAPEAGAGGGTSSSQPASSEQAPTPPDEVGEGEAGEDAAASQDSVRRSRRGGGVHHLPAPTPTQSLRVQVMPEAALVMDVHAHMALSEVIGLLGGTVQPGADPGTPALITVHRAFPCAALPIADDQLVNVEMDPESEVAVRGEIASRGLQCVGWYHSHPTFKATPSVKDVENQLSYQAFMSPSGSSPPVPPGPVASAGAPADLHGGAPAPCCAAATPASVHKAVTPPAATGEGAPPVLPSGVVPFVGVIVSPYNTDYMPDISEIAVFNVTPAPTAVPMAVETSFPASGETALAQPPTPTAEGGPPPPTPACPKLLRTEGVLTAEWLVRAIASISQAADSHLRSTCCEVEEAALQDVNPANGPFFTMIPATEVVDAATLAASSRVAGKATLRPTTKARKGKAGPGRSKGGGARDTGAGGAGGTPGPREPRRRKASAADKAPPGDPTPLSELVTPEMGIVPLTPGSTLPDIPAEITAVCDAKGWDIGDMRQLEREIKLRGVESMRGSMWRVRIFLHSKVVFEGRGSNFVQAARLYDRKSLELRREDAEVNFPSEAPVAAPPGLVASMRASGRPLVWKLARGRRRRVKDKPAASPALTPGSAPADSSQPGTPLVGGGTPVPEGQPDTPTGGKKRPRAEGGPAGPQPPLSTAKAPRAEGGDGPGGAAPPLPAGTVLAANPPAPAAASPAPPPAEAPAPAPTPSPAPAPAPAPAVEQSEPYPHARTPNPFREAVNVDLQAYARSVAGPGADMGPAQLAAVKDMMTRHRFARLVMALAAAGQNALQTLQRAAVAAGQAVAAEAVEAGAVGGPGADAAAPPPAPSGQDITEAAQAAGQPVSALQYTVLHYLQQVLAVAKASAESDLRVLAHPAAETVVLEAVQVMRVPWLNALNALNARTAETMPPSPWSPEAEVSLRQAIMLLRQLRAACIRAWNTARERGTPAHPTAPSAILDGSHAAAAGVEAEVSMEHAVLSMRLPLLTPTLPTAAQGSMPAAVLPVLGQQVPIIADAALRLRMVHTLSAAYPDVVRGTLAQVADVIEYYRVHPSRVSLVRPWRRALTNFTKLVVVVMGWAHLLPLPPALRTTFAWDLGCLLWHSWHGVWHPTPQATALPALPSSRMLALLVACPNRRAQGGALRVMVGRLEKEVAADDAVARHHAVLFGAAAGWGIGPGSAPEGGPPSPPPGLDTEAPPTAEGAAKRASEARTLPPQSSSAGADAQTGAASVRPLHSQVQGQQHLLASALSASHTSAFAQAAAAGGVNQKCNPTLLKPAVSPAAAKHLAAASAKSATAGASGGSASGTQGQATPTSAAAAATAAQAPGQDAVGVGGLTGPEGASAPPPGTVVVVMLGGQTTTTTYPVALAHVQRSNGALTLVRHPMTQQITLVPAAAAETFLQHARAMMLKPAAAAAAAAAVTKAAAAAAAGKPASAPSAP